VIFEKEPHAWRDETREEHEEHEEHIKTFAEILRSEVCKEPETKGERNGGLAEAAER